MVAALKQLGGLLEVSAHPGTESDAELAAVSGGQVSIDLIGNDHPGIVRDVTAVVGRHGLSIDAMDTDTRDAPVTGGRLFEAHIVLHLPGSADAAALHRDLEQLANEILVDLTVDQE